MEYPLLNSYTKLLGPLKVYGQCKPNFDTGVLEGWFYPLFITRKEAIQSDIDRQGKGIYKVIEFYNREGEFYVPESYYEYGAIRDPYIYTAYDGAGAENPFARIQNKLSILIQDQLPEFIQSEYTTFITFLKAYYEFLEQNNQAQEVLQDIRKYSDIDNTSEELVTKFLKNYAEDLTESKFTNNRLLVKKIREIYSRKGTEDSFKILFNILYKETISFFYPYDIVLKTSSGNWKTPYILRVKKTSDTQNIFDFENTEVMGKTSGASAIITTIREIDIGGNLIYELLIDSTSLKGYFLSNEIITAVKRLSFTNSDSINLEAMLYSVVTKIDVIDGGRGYEKNNYIRYITDNRNTGKFANAIIQEVDRYGTIKKILIREAGIDYSDSANVIIDAGIPTSNLSGTYKVDRGVVTVTFRTPHNIVKGTKLNIMYNGNISSPINNTDHNTTVLSTPSNKSIRFVYPGF